MPDKARARILQLKVNQSLRDLRRLDKSAVKDILGELRRARDDMTLLLKSATRFDMPAMRGLRDDISERIGIFERRMSGVISKGQDVSFVSGAGLTDDILRTAGVQFGSPMISEELLVATKELTTDLITGFGDEMRNDIAKSLRRSVLTGDDAFSAARKIDKLIGTKGRGYMNRADTIARDQIGRAFSVARQTKDSEVVKQVPDLRKRWRNSQDVLVRPSPRYPHQSRYRWNHREAHNQIRKVDEPFDVSGEALMYPRDPSGSAENILGCRCQSVPYMEEWEE